MRDSQAQVEKVLLESAVNILPVGVTVACPQGRIIFTNNAEAEMHGWQINELIGNDVGVFAPGNCRKPISINERAYFERETVNIHRSGRVFPVKLISDIVLDGGGEPLGIITACEDMTRIQRSTRDSSAFRIYNFHWQKMEVIGDLVRGIASDIGSALTAIMGRVDLMKKKGDNGQPMQGEYAQLLILFEQTKLLIAELHKFSQTSQVELRVASINEVVKKSQVAMSSIVGPKIEFRFLLGDGIWDVMANEIGIEQILINLVLNAKNAMLNGGLIYIKTENAVFTEAALVNNPNSRLGKYVCLSITDTGLGIEKEIVGKIFDPFFSTMPQGQSLGLGLSVVYRNIELHNGWIEVFSLPGKGTKFQIYLPKC